MSIPPFFRFENPPRNGEVAARRDDGGAESSPACAVLALRRFDPTAPAGHLPEKSSGRSLGWSCLIHPELVSGRGTARRSRVVEGEMRPRRIDNVGERGFQIRQHILRQNTQCGNSVPGKPRVARFIQQGTAAKIMRSAVDLNRQTGIAAEEIEHIGSAWMLAAEFEAAGALAQFRPQQNFGQGHVLTQLSGAVDFSRFRLWRDIFQHRNYPSVSASHCHLPETSSGRS